MCDYKFTVYSSILREKRQEIANKLALLQCYSILSYNMQACSIFLNNYRTWENFGGEILTNHTGKRY